MLSRLAPPSLGFYSLDIIGWITLDANEKVYYLCNTLTGRCLFFIVYYTCNT
ncbi:hypothetical protein VCRA2134O163_10249 [Vibrio crassostreae]|nr:hypothetical protein VCRA2119O381_1760004 [Vibrio crassostreae]CAK2728934.1 hypothetical protein VCRA2134O163_10249 [Vibrio crassostreae]